MIQILQRTRFIFNLIRINIKSFRQLKQHHWNYLHMGNIIYVLKLMSELHGPPNVPDQDHWLKLLRLLFTLENLNRNASVSKGYYRCNNLRNIWSLLGYNNSWVTVLFMKIDFWTTLRSYTYILINMTIRSSIKQLLKKLCYPLLRVSWKIIQCKLACKYL